VFDVLDDFLIFCEIERRLSPLTCKAYHRDVCACLTFMQADDITDLAGIGIRDLRRFLADEATRRPSPSSQSRTIAAMRMFFRFCIEGEYLDRDPAAVLRSPKKREALPDVLDRKELGRLLDMPARDDVWQKHHAGKRERDRLALALLAYSGLRRAELLSLDWDDIDLERRLIKVRVAKGGRMRMIPIHPALIPLFVSYQQVREPIVEPALFTGVQGKRLSSTLLAQMFRRYAEAAGVTKRKKVTPHTLRHVFATELLGAGANLRQIQELLGHMHLDSTQRYTRVTAHQLQGAVKRLPW